MKALNLRWRSLLLWTLVATSPLAAAATSRTQHRPGLDEHLRPLGFVGVDLKSGPAQELLVEGALDDTKFEMGAAGEVNDRVQGVLGNEWLARAGALIHFQSLKCWLFLDSDRKTNSTDPAKSVPTGE